MIIASGENLTIKWLDHKLALSLLSSLFRRPIEVQEAFKQPPYRSDRKFFYYLALHSLPYIIIASLLGRAFIFGASKSSIDTSWIPFSEPLLFHMIWIIAAIMIVLFKGSIFWLIFGSIYVILFKLFWGLVPSIIGGILIVLIGVFSFQAAFEKPNRSIFWLVYGLSFGGALGISGGTEGGIAACISGIAGGIVFPITAVITKRKVEGLAFGITILLTYAVIIIGGTEIVFRLIVFVIAFIVCSTRLYYLIIHPLYFLSTEPEKIYKYHPIAWDDMIKISFPSIERLLAAYAERYPEQGAEEIERLITKYPIHRLAALRAKVKLFAYNAARINKLSELGEMLGNLPEGNDSFFADTKRIREMIQEIYRLQMRLEAMNRPVFREPIAKLICKEIETFQLRVSGFYEPLVKDFSNAALHWLNIAKKQNEELEVLLSKEPIPQVFSAGVPIDLDKAAFIPRYSVLDELDRQTSTDVACPGIVLYGRRRMGKSTILKNLTHFLPFNYQPVVISMENPGAFTSETYFINHIASSINSAFLNKDLLRKDLQDLRDLYNFLSHCNSLPAINKKKFLLAFDEYENIDRKIGEGVFSRDLLATIRESIQTHKQIVWIFTGSHEITELAHALWTSYLISAHTIEVPLFTQEETHLLLTEPLKDSSLWPKDASNRPGFKPEFWGQDGINQIHNETGGWPHLVQLIAQTIIDLVNEKGMNHVTKEIIEKALNKAVIIEQNVLYELMRGESRLPGEWEYISAFRRRKIQPPPDDAGLRSSLRRRLLIIEENDDWRLRVPLMERWLKHRS